MGACLRRRSGPRRAHRLRDDAHHAAVHVRRRRLCDGAPGHPLDLPGRACVHRAQGGAHCRRIDRGGVAGGHAGRLSGGRAGDGTGLRDLAVAAARARAGRDSRLLAARLLRAIPLAHLSADLGHVLGVAGNARESAPHAAALSVRRLERPPVRGGARIDDQHQRHDPLLLRPDAGCLRADRTADQRDRAVAHHSADFPDRLRRAGDSGRAAAVRRPDRQRAAGAAGAPAGVHRPVRHAAVRPPRLVPIERQFDGHLPGDVADRRAVARGERGERMTLLTREEQRWTVRSHTPGRLRASCPALGLYASASRNVESALLDLDSIATYDVNPLTSRVLVKFDPRRITSDEILAALAHATALLEDVTELDPLLPSATMPGPSALHLYFSTINMAIVGATVTFAPL